MSSGPLTRKWTPRQKQPKRVSHSRIRLLSWAIAAKAATASHFTLTAFTGYEAFFLRRRTQPSASVSWAVLNLCMACGRLQKKHTSMTTDFLYDEEWRRLANGEIHGHCVLLLLVDAVRGQSFLMYLFEDVVFAQYVLRELLLNRLFLWRGPFSQEQRLQSGGGSSDVTCVAQKWTCKCHFENKHGILQGPSCKKCAHGHKEDACLLMAARLLE